MITVPTPATYGEATAAGWTHGRQTWELGYVSRRADQDHSPIHYSRFGEPYVLLASYRSTRYCIRQYLLAPSKVSE